jgi:sporulation protein YlmC with PRC-barrel domain
MIKIFVPKDFQKIKKKAAKLVYICLWAYGYLELKKSCLEVEKMRVFKKENKGSKLFHILLALPAPPHNPFIEKQFLKKFDIKRTTFNTALKWLTKKKYLKFECLGAPEKMPFNKTLLKKLEEFRKERKKVIDRSQLYESSRILKKVVKTTTQDLYQKDGFVIDKFYESYIKNIINYSGPYTSYISDIKINPRKKGGVILYVTRRKARFLNLYWEKKLDTIEIPLRTITRKDLSIAERLIGIVFYRMKKEKEDITIKKLCEQSGFSKPTVIKALKKLKRKTSF